MSGVFDKDNEFRRGGLVLIGCFIGLGVAMTALPYYAFGVWTRPWQASLAGRGRKSQPSNRLPLLLLCWLRQWPVN